MQIIKRDGREEPFEKNKITAAISKAFIAVDHELSEDSLDKIIKIGAEIEKHFNSHKNVTVEEIQDAIEKKLMASNRKDVAKAYIVYRDNRSQIREGKTSLMQIVKTKLEATDVQNQNANVDEYSFGGRAGEARDELLKEYALNHLMSDKARNAHLNNEIYTHDLNSYALGEHNCSQLPFDDLLAKGFNTRQTDVRPANSINTAFQLVAVLFQLQSLQQFGGVSAGHLDWTMVPYVRKSFLKHYNKGLEYIYEIEDRVEYETPKYDTYPRKDFQDYMTGIAIDDPIFQEYPKAYNYALKETTKELNQAVEGMYHNLNY